MRVLHAARAPRHFLILPAAAALTIQLAVAGTGVAAGPAHTAAGPRAWQSSSVCGNSAAAPAVQHVIIVMLENESYDQVIGQSATAPYENWVAQNCGSGSEMFATTHSSAADYLAVSSGEYPAKSPTGCGSVKACSDASNNLYSQLSAAGLSWGAFEESMPSACDGRSAAADYYKIGHNPAIFYSKITAAQCRADDVGVPSLTAKSGAFYNDLQAGTLPSLSWITPNTNDDGENPCGVACSLTDADTWLSNFMSIVDTSSEYTNGSTLVLVLYDEGNGSDYKIGENCTNKTQDLAGNKPSCHIPLLVIYPYVPAGDNDTSWFDDYSLTRTVEQLFGLSYLAGAGNAQVTSLVGHFGIPAPSRPRR
jgi:phosphatidylinositol-3-phosphatase